MTTFKNFLENKKDDEDVLKQGKDKKIEDVKF